MNTRLVLSHLAVALIAFGLGYAVFSPGAGGSRAIERPDDPVAAFAAALAVEEPHARAQALLDFFAAADPAWAERLRAEVDPQGSKLVLDEIGETLFASWWARSNPKAAFENIVDPAWAHRHPWLRQVMRTWVTTDPVRAAEAAGSLPPNPDRGKVEATRMLVEHWWDNPVSTDPAPLMALIHVLPVMPRAAAVQRLIEGSIEARGVDATEQFVESLPRQEAFGVSVEAEMLARYGQVLIDHDVDRAIRWAEKHGQGRDGAGILRHMAFSWGTKDGAAAMNWAMNLPDTPERPAVLMRVWLSYRESRPEEAAEWLLAQQPTAALEGIYQRFLSGTAGLNANKALEIASKTQDPMLRERLLAAVGVGWMKTDPEAAKKWLETVELAPELEDRVRQSVPTPPQNMDQEPAG